MGRRDPVEKLPLAARKNLRDSWEAKKEEIANKTSEILGQTWTVDADEKQIYAYAEEGYAKESPGSMIAQYFEAANDRLKSFVERNGEGSKKEINDVCTAHKLILDVNIGRELSYNGVAVLEDGSLAILFNEDRLAVNIDDALAEDKLQKALNEAPTTAATMSFVARSGIEKDWEPEYAAIQDKIRKTLQDEEITLDPRFQETHDALKSAGGQDADRWEQNLGNFTKMYFEAAAGALESQQFGSDEMLREAILEEMGKKTVAFRVVEKGKMKKSYNESVLEDGVLYLQTAAEYFGTNIDNIANDLVDLM